VLIDISQNDIFLELMRRRRDSGAHWELMMFITSPELDHARAEMLRDLWRQGRPGSHYRVVRGYYLMTKYQKQLRLTLFHAPVSPTTVPSAVETTTAVAVPTTWHIASGQRATLPQLLAFARERFHLSLKSDRAAAAAAAAKKKLAQAQQRKAKRAVITD